MRRIFLIMTLFVSWLVSAQPYKEIETNNIRIDPDWVETFKSSGFCWAYDILVDDVGNTYSCGYFKNALITGDSVLTPKKSTGGSGQETSFLIKRNDSGKPLWMLHIGGNNRPSSLQFGNDGSIILLGLEQAEYSYFIEASGKETQLARAGNGRIFIARISTDGSLLKAVSLPNENPQYGHDIKEDSKGNWYIAGEENFRRPDRPSYVQNRYLLIKLNPDWEIQWIQRGDTAQTSIFSCLALVGKDIYTGGSYHQSLKIDEFQLDRKKQEQYPLLVKWDSEGKPEWVRDELSSYPTGHISNFVNDSKGNIYAWAGSSYSYAMLAKFSRKGEKLWAIDQKGKASVYTEKMLIDSKDRLYLCGQSYGNIFGSTNGETYSSKTKGGTDPYLASYNNEGVLLWIKVYGGKGTDYCKSIAINDSNLYSFGWTNTTMDFFNKQFTGRGYIFYTAKFQLKDLAFMDKSAPRLPLDTAEKWPKVNQQSCECESKPNAKIGYASTVKGLLSYEKFQELTGWSVIGGDSVYNKLFFVNFQSSLSMDQAYYSMKLISFQPILLEAPDRSYRIELNSCSNESRHRDLSLNISFSEPIQHYDRGFNRNYFDSSASSYLNLMSAVSNAEEKDLLLIYLFSHAEKQYDEVLAEIEKQYDFKLDSSLEDEEEIAEIILDKMEENEGNLSDYLVNNYLLEKKGKHPITKIEKQRLDGLFRTVDYRLNTAYIDQILQPEVSLSFNGDWMRFVIDGSILHPWDQQLKQEARDSNGHIESASILVEANKFYFNNKIGTDIKIKSQCMPLSEIGNTGILIKINGLIMTDYLRYKNGLMQGYFPTLVPDSAAYRSGEFDNPPKRVPLLANFNGLLAEDAQVQIPIEGQFLICEAQNVAFNNQFLAGTILLKAEAEVEGESLTGRIRVHLPEGDVYYSPEALEKLLLDLGMKSVQCQYDRYGVMLYFAYSV